MGFHQEFQFFKGPKPEKEYDFPVPEGSERLIYLSKEHGLHVWMKQLYYRKKSADMMIDEEQEEQEKCKFFTEMYSYTSEPLYLTEEDVMQLDRDIKNGEIFFFRFGGGFIEAVLEKMREGFNIFYEGDGV